MKLVKRDPKSKSSVLLETGSSSCPKHHARKTQTKDQ